MAGSRNASPIALRPEWARRSRLIVRLARGLNAAAEEGRPERLAAAVTLNHELPHRGELIEAARHNHEHRHRRDQRRLSPMTPIKISNT